MKLVFAGTPAFAATALAALIAAGHEIVLVLAQPDRPAGRGMQLTAGPVRRVADDHGIPVIQPHGLRIGGRHDADARAAIERLAATPHDAMIVAAYGLIVPPAILAIPRLGCINIHASLLPRWRGAAPVQRAIEAGDATTGITIMQMDAGLDTGAMLLVRPVAILPDDTGGSLTDRLAIAGGAAIVEALPALAAGALVPTPQHPPDDAGAVTYATKLAKPESVLDFASTSRALVDRIRAFDPWPGCTTTLEVAGRSAAFKVWKALVVATEPRAAPGTLLEVRDGQVVVATADGAIALLELQKPGGKRLPAPLFATELAQATGRRFGVAA